MNTNHIKAKEGGALLVCEHCGNTYRVSLPAPVTLYVGILDKFIELHADFTKPDKPA